MIGRWGHVAQQRRWLIHVHDERSHLAFAVEVAEWVAATGMAITDAGATGDADVVEFFATFIARQNARDVLLDFRVDVAVDPKEIEPAIIVEIGKSGTPADVAIEAA